MFEDTSGEILKQLTRIADAMNKPGPSPWADSIKAVATFVAGLVSAYIALILQGRASDRREQSRMRRIVYSELAESFLLGHQMAAPLTHPTHRRTSLKLLKDLCTFVGETYMKEHRDVFYRLSEGTSLTCLYTNFHTLRAGETYPLVLFKFPLREFSELFRTDPSLRKYFKKFIISDKFHMIESAVQQYDSKITLEDLGGTGDGPRRPLTGLKN